MSRSAEAGDMSSCPDSEFGPFRFKVNPELIPVSSHLAKYLEQCNYPNIIDLDDEDLEIFYDFGDYSRSCLEEIYNYKHQSKKFQEMYKKKRKFS